MGDIFLLQHKNSPLTTALAQPLKVVSPQFSHLLEVPVFLFFACVILDWLYDVNLHIGDNIGCILFILILAFVFPKNSAAFLLHPMLFTKFLWSLRALG